MNSLNLRFNQHCTEVIMCGYLFKSPPIRDQKKTEPLLRALTCTGGTPKFFKKRWRERYCVLYKLRSRDKTEIFFEYYKDSNCSKLKGQVDLKNCDCIIDDDNSGENWPNVFSVQTIHNGQKRVYYFSAPSAQNMSDWVRHLVDVTGFVVTLTSDYPSPIPRPLHGSLSGWGSRRLKPLSASSCANPFNTISGSLNPHWLAETTAQPLQTTGSDLNEDVYRESGSAGLEYLLSGPEDERDTYYKVPGLSHSYVNLSTASGVSENTVQFVHHSRSQSSVAATNTHADSAQEQLSKPSPLPIKQPPDSVDGSNSKPESTTGLNKHVHRLGSSNNNLYFNVWEASEEDDGDYVSNAFPSDSTVTETTMRPAAVGSKQPNIPKPNVRVYRRSKIISEYHQLPMALPTTFVPSPMTESAPLPTRKPGTSLHSVPHQAPTSTALSPLSIPVNHEDAPSAADLSPTDADLTLPTRVPGSRSADDSSLESRSISSKSLSNSDLTVNEPHLETCTSTGPPLDAAPIPPTSLGMGTLERMSTNNELLARATCEPVPAVVSSRAAPSLNYIEPYNLDLGDNPSDTRSHSPFSSGKSVTAISLCKHSVDNGMSSMSPDIHAKLLPVIDDYKTEYKEIDPISTNALAHVAKRYLDNDLAT